MPDNVQNTLSPEDAYNVLVAQVHAPVFFEKLARVYGIRPRNQEEARDILTMAGELRNAHEQHGTKAAAAASNFYGNARRDLAKALTTQGFAPLVDERETVKQAAAAAVQNPLIREAALVFNQYLQQAANG